MTRTRRTVSAAILAVTACSSAGPWDLEPTPVPGLPERLSGSSGVTLSSTVCVTRLLDAESATRFVLVRSIGGTDALSNPVGDYEVAGTTQLPLRPDQLLRVECSTGLVLGAVPREP